MKLVRQVTLEFREGTSDKVYEVDLCEVGSNQFVVNFRYGRRGSTLRDGSKTPASVSEAEAVRIFDALVASKVDKGYRQPGSVPTVAPELAETMPTAGVLDARGESVLSRLTEGHSSKRDWPLSRAVWRCGELRLVEAEPLLIGLVGSGDAMLDYSIAWALGQCGSQASIALLRGMESDHKADSVRRIAGVALMEVLDGPEREQEIAGCIRQLPEDLQHLATAGPAASFHEGLIQTLAEGGGDASFLLEIVYLIDNEHVRPALLDFLRTARLVPGYFHRVRHIFKAAELRRDDEVFGILARRFEVTLANFRMRGRWYYPKRQLPTTGANPTQAFSGQTRTFLRRRVWRTLDRFGDLGLADAYVSLAAGVLRAFSDADALPTRQESRYHWDPQTRRHGTSITHFDRYAAYIAFNWILFGNSNRYSPELTGLRFQCVSPFEPGGNEPLDREEAYPDLWDQHPERVLRLLIDSRCEPVHFFGVKVLFANSEFCRELSVDAIVALLQSPYGVTTEFSFNLAVARYDVANPDLPLVLALANCVHQPARLQAFDWITADRSRFLADREFAVSLIAGPHADTRAFARNSLRQVTIADANAQAMIGRLISILRGLGDDDAVADDGPLAADIVETLLLVFGHHLRRIGEDIIRDLLGHVLPEVQRFAGDLVLGHDTFAKHPPDDVIRLLLEAEHEAVRGIGEQIIAQLSDDVLRNSVEMLIGLTRHEKPDVRAAIRPTVKRLCDSDSAFGELIVGVLIEALLTPGAAEGVPTHTPSGTSFMCLLAGSEAMVVASPPPICVTTCHVI